MSLSDFDLIKLSLTELFSFCVNLWTEIVDATHTAGFYIGCVAVFLAVRFFIIPIVGSYIGAGSSDVVKDIRGKNKKKGSKGNASNKNGGKRK